MLRVTLQRSASLLSHTRSAKATAAAAAAAAGRGSGRAAPLGSSSSRSRCMASSSGSGSAAAALVFEVAGEPLSVLTCQQLPAPPPRDDEITVSFKLAPINPSDINTVQGKYPLRPPLPGVPGHEGLGEVTALGSKVTGLSVGDWVVPLEPCIGTWRQQGTFPAAAFHRIPSDIPAEAAAMLCINPPSALAMLERFVTLQPGDTVVQNGANSAVGKIVIQLAKAMNVKTVNIIRERPNWDETVQELTALGADVVTTEARAKEDLKAAGLESSAVLGLNCVGGSAAVTVAKLLRQGGCVVTYGAMSMQPLSIPTSLLIFKDISFKGFWLSGRLAEEQGVEGRSQALDRLVKLIQQGKLETGPTRKFPLAGFKEALEYYQQEHRGAKVLFEM